MNTPQARRVMDVTDDDFRPFVKTDLKKRGFNAFAKSLDAPLRGGRTRRREILRLAFELWSQETKNLLWKREYFRRYVWYQP